MSDFEPLHPTVYRLGARVCPLFRLDDASRGYLVGTAVPISHAGHHFLVTAAHVLEQSKDGMWITINNIETIAVGGREASYGHVRGRTIDTDIGLIRLSRDQARQMGEEFVFTYFEDVGDVLPYDKLTVYALLGYPHSKHRPKPRMNHELRVTPQYLILREFENLSEWTGEGKREPVHFALAAPDKKLTDMKGARLTLPKMQGVSGGGIWRISINPSTGEIGEPVLVGIGIEHHRKKGAFIGTSIHAAAPLIKELIVATE